MHCPAQPLDAFVPEEGTMVAANTIFQQLNSEIRCLPCLKESYRAHGFMRGSTESYKGLSCRRYTATGSTPTLECQYKVRLTSEEYINNAFYYFHRFEGSLEKMWTLDGILETTIDDLRESDSEYDRLYEIWTKWIPDIGAMLRANESAESGGHATSGREEERGGASTQAGNTNPELMEVSDMEPPQHASGRQGPASAGPITQALTQAPPVHAVDRQKRRAADGEPCASSSASKRPCNVGSSETAVALASTQTIRVMVLWYTDSLEARVTKFKITGTTTARQLADAIDDSHTGKDMIDHMLKYQDKCLWNGDWESREAGVHRPLVEMSSARHVNAEMAN